MRKAFIKSLVSHAESSESVFLVVGDLGFGVIENFSEKFPHRFLNAGVAEQSMVSLAAGLARTGRHVFVYSIANFPTFRALEQIRNDVAYHRLPVTIVSVGAGLGYGTLGYSHHAVEDIAVMGSLQNMVLYSPADAFEVEACVDLILERAGPSYLRLGKGGEPAIHNQKPQSVETGHRLFGHREKVVVLATGGIASNVVQAIRDLGNDYSEDISLFSVPVLSRGAIQASVSRECRAVITVEEHSIRGGFGSFVSEILAPEPSSPPVISIGIDEPQNPIVGSHNFLLEHHGLSVTSIARHLKNVLQDYP